MISARSVAGPAIPVGAAFLTPVARRWRVRWPGGGIVWATPLEVVVEEPGRALRVHVVTDVTRLLQVALLSIGLASALVLRPRPRTGRRKRR